MLDGKPIYFQWVSRLCQETVRRVHTPKPSNWQRVRNLECQKFQNGVLPPQEAQQVAEGSAKHKLLGQNGQPVPTGRCCGEAPSCRALQGLLKTLSGAPGAMGSH